MPRWLVVAVVGGALLCPAAVRADQPEPRSQVIAFEVGLVRSPRDLTDGGPDGSVWAPPVYVGGVFDRRVLPHFHLEAQVGAGGVEGWRASLSPRLAAEVSRLTVSIGAGPAVATGATWSGPPAPFVDADLSAILHFPGPLVLVFRTGAEWALANRGSPTCGVDTCDPHLLRGDRIMFARAGIGWSF